MSYEGFSSPYPVKCDSPVTWIVGAVGWPSQGMQSVSITGFPDAELVLGVLGARNREEWPHEVCQDAAKLPIDEVES